MGKAPKVCPVAKLLNRPPKINKRVLHSQQFTHVGIIMLCT